MLVCKPFRQGLWKSWLKWQQVYEINKSLVDFGNCKENLQLCVFSSLSVRKDEYPTKKDGNTRQYFW
jgi:hypothetical protein